MNGACGCCGRETDGAIWCADCLGHVAESGAPWDRTFFAVYGRACPFESDGGDADDYDDGPEPDCLICGGEGYVYGEDMGDPLWYDADEVVTCTSCRGSGLRKDMTWM